MNLGISHLFCIVVENNYKKGRRGENRIQMMHSGLRINTSAATCVQSMCGLASISSVETCTPQKKSSGSAASQLRRKWHHERCEVSTGQPKLPNMALLLWRIRPLVQTLSVQFVFKWNYFKPLCKQGLLYHYTVLFLLCDRGTCPEVNTLKQIHRLVYKTTVHTNWL